MRWVGIDEAGYGPNLGPLVMTAVVAESVRAEPEPADSAFDLWGELAGQVDRAGGKSDCLWVDDSKAVHRQRGGRARLEEGALAALEAAAGERPHCFRALLERLGQHTLAAAELEPWLSAPAVNARLDRPWDIAAPTAGYRNAQALVHPAGRWRIAQVACALVGPRQFNLALDRLQSKAAVHFETFASLLRSVWPAPGRTRTVSDIHGGRRYYLEPLSSAFPDMWIDRGEESNARSCYRIRAGEAHLELELRPRADAGDGLVALASMVSKSVRELWMDLFNTFWIEHVPGLKPTAGYPTDARRFRQAVEPVARSLALDPELWWRAK